MAYTKNKEIVSRIVHKHDTEANWLKATSFTPLLGEIIVYDIDATHEHERFKIGDGKTLVNNLPFQVDISDFEDYKVKQDIVVDPTASGNALAFIDSISQDEMGKITVTKKNVGKVSTAGTADKLSSLTVTLTGDVTGTQTITNSNSVSIATDLSETGVTAGAYGTDGKALTHGDTFTVPNFSVDAEGRLTAAANKTFTMPAAVDISGKMDKSNPTGTGSFSLNRKADTTIGLFSFSEGGDTTASGNYSHAEGLNTTASGETSHAEGQGTTASNDYSHAENLRTTASGMASHAEGQDTVASGGCSHAEGMTAQATGTASHAEGKSTQATGSYSHTEGQNTTAKSKSQHVQGEYNVVDDTGSNTTRGTYAHIVGNGTNGHPSNAHTLDWSGNAWFSGDVYVGSTYGTEQDEGSKKLATEEYVGNQITANAPNLSNYKTKQTAVSSPTASGNATAFIDTISQDANGKITVTKKNITASALGLDRAMSFLGTTTTALEDEDTTNPIMINSASTTAAKGDVVIVSGTDQEFIWTGSKWEEFGNASSHSIKGHTHTVTHKPEGTVNKTSITPAGTVSQPTFTGSAVNSGENTGTNFSAAPGGHKHSVTAAGTVSQPTFTGTEATITISHTPAGTVSKPTFTGTAVTSGKPDTTNVTTIYSITGVGSLPSASLSAGTAPSHTYTAPSLTASIANKCMTFSWSAGSHSFSAGTYPTLTFSAGSLPTRSSAISMPNTNHTHSVTAAGTVSQPTFTGSSVSGSTKYTPAGTVSQPTFTGSAVNSGANTGTNTSVAPAKHKHSVTAAGTVSQPTFTGTAAEHSHTFTGTSATITTSGSSN